MNILWISFCSSALGSRLKIDSFWSWMRCRFRSETNYCVKVVKKIEIGKGLTFTTDVNFLLFFICWLQWIYNRCRSVCCISAGHQKQCSGQFAPTILHFLFQPNNNFYRWTADPAHMSRKADVRIVLKYINLYCIQWTDTGWTFHALTFGWMSVKEIWSTINVTNV